ncbi:DUF2268 domain-containing putative Zn-dependent protease [Alicyclobacillus macrosporangiidus]|uniref:Predicted Zn-dependent protease n=1 Tax=Alicyclobacillus macrosporangiidus TaxID=392015 RepID=A0A1I7KNR5_9BACL|nr:DUF2268 domain-containing putative Zn-dependent protease [Alicyclobacillus macrosporangiidus]SFU99060.1 Predicted Zn-dependent protease [Alicyclobacillus macrosporangiidus]
MPRWHWIYRDFVESVDNLSGASWPQSVTRYLEQNWALLKSIHFGPRGFESYREVMTHFQILTRERYSSLLDKLPDPPTFELTVTSIVERLLRHLNLQEQDQDVYVIVGLDCTNIYSTEYEGRPVTVLCLEATNGDFREIELLFAHEVHHWKRQSLIPHNIFEFSVYERCATEGLAICFSEEIQPGRAVHEYCFVPPESVVWVQSHIHELTEAIRELRPFETQATSALFSRRPEWVPIPGMPPRTGYVYGYLRTRAFLSRTRTNATEMAHVDCDAIFGGAMIDG